MATTLLRKTREYIDLDFSFVRHPITDNLSIKKKVNAVKQSILHLLRLRAGDKPFHPEIKSPIYEYLFENASAVLKVVIEGEVRKYLNVYEPRVRIDSVEVTFTSGNSLNCDISGEIINIQEPFTVSLLVDRLR